MKKTAILLTVLCVVMGLYSVAFSLDPKHNAPIACTSCHVSHSSIGGGMTNADSNSNLCLSCHTSPGMGGKKLFVDTMKAVTVAGKIVEGTSHAWDVFVVNTDRGTSYPTNPEVFLRLDPIIKGTVTETSANNSTAKHLSVVVPAVNGDLSGKGKVIQFYSFEVLAGGTASGGTTSTVTDSSRNWVVNNYVNYYVRMTSGANKGKARAIASNTNNTLTLFDPFLSTVASGDVYEIYGPTYANSGQIKNVISSKSKAITDDPNNVEITEVVFDGFPQAPLKGEKFAIMGTDAKFGCSVCHNQHLQKSEPWTASGPYVEYKNNPSNDPVIAANNAKASNSRKFLRIDNDRSQLCLECHSSRATAHAVDTRTWDGQKKSHPVGKIFATATGLTPDVLTPSQFNAVPLKPDGSAQTKKDSTDKRYSSNSSSDTNLTNNLVLDPDGRIACLSCHGIHYTDSKASTVDKP